jgi:hypothetical protein
MGLSCRLFKCTQLAAEVEAQTGVLVDITDWSGRDWRL